MRRHQLAQMLVIGVVASAIGVALALADRLVPGPGSTQAEEIDTLYDVLLISSVPIFVLVDGRRPLLGLAVPDAPGRGEPGRPADPRQHAAGGHLDGDPGDHAGRRSCTYAYDRARTTSRAPRRASGRSASAASSSRGPSSTRRRHGRQEVRLQRALRAAAPAGEVRRHAQGRHPRLLGPGVADEDRRGRRVSRPTYRVTPNRLGTYPVVCAELCGLGHSVMRQTAHVVSRRPSRPG